MMRSLFSGVSGLKTHQTKMDVIGNNISNVNTVAFKSSSTTFSDLMYQTTSQASSATATRGGTNAKQIGLGVMNGATKISITSSGAAQSTGDALDLRLTDTKTTNFFVVSNGTENLFTRAGSFYIDGNGNLAMTTTGYLVMGWQVDPATGTIAKDTVSALRVMQASNQTSNPEATTQATFSGVIDKNDTNITSDNGYVRSLTFYDSLGYSYTAKFSMKLVEPAEDGKYSIKLTNVYNSEKPQVDIYAKYLQEAGQKAVDDLLTKTPTATEAAQETARQEAITKAEAAVFGATDSEAVSASGLASGYSVDDSGKLVYKEDGITYSTTTTIKDLLGSVSANSGEDANRILNNTDKSSGISLTGNDSTGTSKTITKTLKDIFGLNTNNMTLTGFKIDVDGADTTLTLYKQATLFGMKFDTQTGTLTGLTQRVTDAQGNSSTEGIGTTCTFNASLLGPSSEKAAISNITMDMSQLLNYDNGGTSTSNLLRGGLDGTTGAGKKLGSMTGLSVNGDGKIYGSYDNGNTVLLGQIACAQFANASGLEEMGDNCYKTTLNSGEFDGIGIDISADGSTMSTGQLEMSNVDLSQEFTEMIVTQRGFQANSRIITTSDTLLEELINLKR